MLLVNPQLLADVHDVVGVGDSLFACQVVPQKGYFAGYAGYVLIGDALAASLVDEFEAQPGFVQFAAMQDGAEKLDEIDKVELPSPNSYRLLRGDELEDAHTQKFRLAKAE